MRYVLAVSVALACGAGEAFAETLDEQVVRLYSEGKFAEAEPLAKRAVEESIRDQGLTRVSPPTNLDTDDLAMVRVG